MKSYGIHFGSLIKICFKGFILIFRVISFSWKLWAWMLFNHKNCCMITHCLHIYSFVLGLGWCKKSRRSKNWKLLQFLWFYNKNDAQSSICFKNKYIVSFCLYFLHNTKLFLCWFGTWIYFFSPILYTLLYIRMN